VPAEGCAARPRRVRGRILDSWTSIDEQLAQVTARAREVWSREAADIWLGSANAFLGGARPVDVARLEGAQRVVTNARR
jgi:hypothetical protein